MFYHLFSGSFNRHIIIAILVKFIIYQTVVKSSQSKFGGCCNFEEVEHVKILQHIEVRMPDSF